jgi:hypothetical protein
MWVGQPRIHETDYYVFNTGMRLREAAEPTNTQASATRATPTQPGFALPISALAPAFLTTCRLLAGTDRPAQPAHPQQPHTARAPAGRHSPTESRGFRPLNHHPPPLQPPSPRPRVPTGSAVPRSTPRSCSKATRYALPAREAPPKSAIPPKPRRSDSTHAYRVEGEACARRNYTYAMDTVKDG